MPPPISVRMSRPKLNAPVWTSGHLRMLACPRRCVRRQPPRRTSATDGAATGARASAGGGVGGVGSVPAGSVPWRGRATS